MKSFGCLALFVFVSACNTKQQKQPTAAAVRASECLPRMKEFLRWYPTHEGDSTTYFVNIPLNGDETPAVRAQMLRGVNVSRSGYTELNREKLEHYMEDLRRSGYFSASYLTEKRALVLRRGAEMEAKKITEQIVAKVFDASEIIGVEFFWGPETIDQLKPYEAPGLVPPAQAYQLLLSSKTYILLYTKPEGSRCVVDSMRSYAPN